MSNTRLTLSPLTCPRSGCARPLQAKVNGGALYLECTQESPKCGIIVPASTALAWNNENQNQKRDPNRPPLMDGAEG